MKKGILTQARADDILQKDFENYDLILHEMGIPPIHTPCEVLQAFPEKVKEKMFLVHVSEDKIPKGVGLKSGPVGLENTVILVKEPT